MRIINLTTLLMACCLISGCKTTQHNVPPPIDSSNVPIVQPSTDGDVVVIPPNHGRDDLPNGWNAVGLDNWSYGVPPEFNSNSIDGGSKLASNTSTNSGLTIEFEKIHTSLTDLHQYVLMDFILVKMTQNAEILQERTKTDNNGEQTVSVQVLMPKTQDGQISSLDFFRMKNQEVYHLSCFGQIANLKNNKDICFQIVDSLKISN